jgi:hypothetical protein
VKTIASPRQTSWAFRPDFDGLEGRKMLSLAGDLGHWAPDARITYSFIPDGTNVGGVPSRLDQSLGADGLSTRDWQQQFRQATALWGAAIGIQFVQVPDDGSPLGAPSPARGNASFGEIRIGGIGLAGNELALAFLPSPNDAGALSGDIIFNVNQPFTNIARTFAFEPTAGTDAPATLFGGRFDFMTVALHESGHSLGLADIHDGHSVMSDVYNGPHRALDESDLALLSRIPTDPNSEDIGAGTPTLARDMNLEPGGSATLGIRVATQGFYILQVRAEGGGIDITRTGPGGPVSLSPAAQTLMYLAPGEYQFRLQSVGPGTVHVRLGFSTPPVDPQSLLSGGVGQGPALTSVLVVSVGVPSTPSSASASLPLVAATSAGMTSGVPALPVVALASTAGTNWTIAGDLVGRPTSLTDNIAAVGPGVGGGTTALAYNGHWLPAGIDLGLAVGPTSPDRPIATAVRRGR